MAKDPIKTIVLQDGTKRYRFVVDIGRDANGKRKQLTVTKDTKREAVAELARIRHQRSTGSLVAPSKTTVNELLDLWLRSATRDVEKATAANYVDAVRPARERLGDRPVQQLREEDIEDLVDWMLKEGRRRGGKPGTGLSPRSVRLTLGRLRSALNEAVRRQLVVRNVAQEVKIPRAASKAAAESKARHSPWTMDEVKAFLAGIKGERLYAVMLLSLMGLRPAEVCGLRWIDVDFEASTIAAGRNTRTLVNGEVEEKGAKSDAGDRGLPAPAVVMGALKAFKTVQAAERLAAGDVYEASGYVLVDDLGAPQRTDWLRRRAYELMAKVGVRRVRLYDARHACLSWMANNGVPDTVVSAWAGHADLSFTKRVYVHPDPQSLKAGSEKLSELLG